MKWKSFLTGGMAFVVLILVIYYRIDLQDKKNVLHGVFDASSLTASSVVELDGEWEFYWGQLLGPKDFLEGKQGTPTWTQVPGNWTKDLEGNAYPKTGHATYRMMVEHLTPGQVYSIKKENIRNASRLYINGSLVMENGSFDEEGSQEEGNTPQTTSFRAATTTATLIVQAVNKQYLIGGIAGPLLLGHPNAIKLHNDRHMIWEVFAFALVLSIGVFYMIFYASSPYFRKRELAILPFGLTCIFTAIILSYLSQRTLSLVFPEISFDNLFRIGHISNYVSITMLLLIIHRTHERFLSRKAMRLLAAGYSFCVLFVAVAPPLQFIRLGTFMGIINLLIVVTMFLKVLIEFYRGSDWVEPRIHAVLIGALFCVNAYTLDVGAYSFGLKSDMNIGIAFVILYALMLAFLVIIRYYLTFQNNERVSLELGQSLHSLNLAEQKSRRNEMAFLQAQIKPHFLFNVLNSIISLCYVSPAQAPELLQKLSGYLRQSFDRDSNSEFVTVRNELDLIRLYVDIERVRFGDRLQMEYAVDPEALDVYVIPLVIEPLVENAIQHGVMSNREEGRVRLVIRHESERLHISVEDNGRGMTPGQIEAVKSSVGKLRDAEGSGVGLVNINSRLREYYGEELAFEASRAGTCVSFYLPIAAEGKGEQLG